MGCIIRQEESLKEAFERLDVDSTGVISRDNLKAVLGKTYDNSLIDKMLEVKGLFCPFSPRCFMLRLTDVLVYMMYAYRGGERRKEEGGGAKQTKTQDR